MPRFVTEDMIEQAAIELLGNEYAPHYVRLDCYTENPETLPDKTGRSEKKQVVLPEVLFTKICELNPEIPAETIKQTSEEHCRIIRGDPLE